MPSPTPGAYPWLTGVAARGPSDVYAVGNNLPSINGGVAQGLILRWNGSAWSADTDPTDAPTARCTGPRHLARRRERVGGRHPLEHSLILSHG